MTLTRASITLNDSDGQILTFLAPLGLYTGDIATATGIDQSSSENNLADNTLISIKSLIRSGKLGSINVRVKDSTSGKSWTKKIRFNTETEDVATNLVGKTWPVGKAAGFPITDVIYPTRIVSRE